MPEQLPLTDPYFATEEEGNIVNNIPPKQATRHNGGHPGLLVGPPLPRNRTAEMWLHHAEMVCGRPKKGIPRKAVKDPPPTQQFVSGRIT